MVCRIVFSMTVMTYDEIIKLSPAERLALIGELWDSLEDKDVPLTKAQEEELDLRLENLEEDRKRAITWEDLKARMSGQ